MGARISRFFRRQPKKTQMEKHRALLHIPKYGHRVVYEGHIEEVPLDELPSLSTRMAADIRASGVSGRLTYSTLVGDYFTIIKIKNLRRRKAALNQFRINHPQIYHQLHRPEDDPLSLNFF